MINRRVLPSPASKDEGVWSDQGRTLAAEPSAIVAPEPVGRPRAAVLASKPAVGLPPIYWQFLGSLMVRAEIQPWLGQGSGRFRPGHGAQMLSFLPKDTHVV